MNHERSDSSLNTQDLSVLWGCLVVPAAFYSIPKSGMFSKMKILLVVVVILIITLYR